MRHDSLPYFLPSVHDQSRAIERLNCEFRGPVTRVDAENVAVEDPAPCGRNSAVYWARMVDSYDTILVERERISPARRGEGVAGNSIDDFVSVVFLMSMDPPPQKLL